MGAIEFVVPVAPPAMNVMLRKHWSYRKNQKTLWCEFIRSGLGVKDLSAVRAWAELGHRMHVELTVHHRRSFDPDNLVSCAKIPLDALKELRCLLDDSTRYIDLTVSEVVSKEVRTIVRLTDLDGANGAGRPKSLARYTTRRRSMR